MSRDLNARRRFIRHAAAFSLLPGLGMPLAGLAEAPGAGAGRARVRPGDAAWPAETEWQGLSRQVQGRLIRPESRLLACAGAPRSPACDRVFQGIQNPYLLGDDPALTQTLGWVDAWTSMPSAYAVAARSTEDVRAAVDFARRHRLRLVVKGGGHSYQGTSNAADSLLVWTRGMNAIQLHDGFVPQGCDRIAAPQRAVTIEAGALWGAAYDAVTTRGGGYVQGGGCMTVGVAGLVQSGGFGSFSKRFGLAAASLLQAEVVTADGAVRTVNACREPELFWGLKGGGGGSMGVLTRLTLQVHPLPDEFGTVTCAVRARSDQDFRRLLDLTLRFYAERLHNPHWGEQIRIRPGNTIRIEMLFQGLNRGEAQAVWQPFFQTITELPDAFEWTAAPFVMALPARTFWAPSTFKKMAGFMKADDRPDAPEGNVFWAGDQGQAGQVLHGYESCWLPATLLAGGERQRLVDALFDGSRHGGIALHVNKGLAGADPAARRAARDTATHPAVLEAFALAISATEGPAAYPGVPGHEPDVERGRQRARSTAAAMAGLRRLLPTPASYLAESNYFERDWQRAFWGDNHARLQAVKRRYDPDGLFFVHHGVGSEGWSADGFSPLT
ncbi:FAD-linked oxidoreductase family [Burkholderiales bacterium 8X]|nr:FAD-linked oxidoreductase family [Burkholderiales bacterium 8X]